MIGTVDVPRPVAGLELATEPEAARAGLMQDLAKHANIVLCTIFWVCIVAKLLRTLEAAGEAWRVVAGVAIAGAPRGPAVRVPLLVERLPEQLFVKVLLLLLLLLLVVGLTYHR